LGQNEIPEKQSERYGVRPPLEKAWEFQADSSIYPLREACVIAAQNSIFFGSKKGLIYMLDVMSGSVKWTFQMGKGLKLPPVEANGIVFAPSSDKRMYALDAQTGNKLWQFTSGKDFVSWNDGPVVAQGAVYVATKDKKLHAIDAETGEERWQFSCGDEIQVPALGHGAIFFGCKDKHVYAIDVSSGTKRWAWKTGHKTHSYPAMADDRVLIAGDDDLYAFEPNDGTVSWEAREVLHEGNPPTVVGGIAYCTKDLVGLDVTNGEVIERFTHKGVGTLLSSIVVHDGTLYANRSSWVYTIPPHKAEVIFGYDVATRNEQWHAFARHGMEGWEVRDGFVFVTSLLNLIVINTSKFAKRWKSEPIHGGVMESIGRPVIVCGTVFVAYSKGLHAFRSSTDPASQYLLEVQDEVSPSPEYEVETYDADVVWPDCCCLCCSPAEEYINLEKEFTFFGLSETAMARGVPYCKECRKRTSGLRHEKPGVAFESAIPITYVFRNERYCAMFMEANRLR